MSELSKVISLSYDSAGATITSALKTYYRSVRLIKNSGTINPTAGSKYTNILLCGNCVDPATRNIYVFYIDMFYNAAWIIEINIDSRVQTVVYYDKLNKIGFDPLHKIYNPRVVFGRIIWTDNKNPIYQMDVARAKKSFALGIGYGQNEVMAEWVTTTAYPIGRIVSNGTNFYQALVYNSGTEPRLDNGDTWKKLCLIEDAYYSMNIENFYFEAMPPKHPPVVTYQSDDTRKVNNLRQTLFQIAYRYVYMDWRKSTFSPASIVPVPQAEEETATGLANEQISLNNKLNINFNTGGEEVRAIEIIGRSSQDPSKWFLIDTIYKFTEQERGNEISITSLPGYVSMQMTIMPPTVIHADAPSVTINSIDTIIDGTQDTAISNLFRYTNAGGDGTLTVSWLLSDDALGESVIDSGNQSTHFGSGSFSASIGAVTYGAVGTRYLFVWLVDFATAVRSNAFQSVAYVPPPLPVYSLFVDIVHGHYPEPAVGTNVFLELVYNTGDNSYYGDIRCHYFYIDSDNYPAVSEWIGTAYQQTIPVNVASVPITMTGQQPIGLVNTAYPRSVTMEYFNGTSWVVFFYHEYPAQ